MRPLLPVTVAVLLGASPAAAATLAPNAPCAAPGEQVLLTGAGFAPLTALDLTLDGQPLENRFAPPATPQDPDGTTIDDGSFAAYATLRPPCLPAPSAAP